MLAMLLLTCWFGLAEDIAVPPDDDPLRISEEMKKFLDASIGRGGDSLQRTRTLVEVIFQENALHFTYVPETRTAIETFNSRSGNCLSFTFLFIAMARHLGIDARFREVDIVPIWSQVGNITSLSGHANAAVLIGSEIYVVDLFPQVNRIVLGGRVVSDARAVAHFLNNKGVNLLLHNRSESALEYFGKALDSDPTTVRVWDNMGVAYSELGQVAEAERSYRKALELDSGNLVAISNLADLYKRIGRERDARVYLAKARKFNQRNPYYHFKLGMQAYNSGEYSGSVEHFRAAARLKSTEYRFYLALAKAYAQLGRVDKACSSLRLAVKNAPDDASKSRFNEKLSLWALAQSSHGTSAPYGHLSPPASEKGVIR